MYTPCDVNGYYTIKRKNETSATMCVVISFFYLYNGWRKVEKIKHLARTQNLKGEEMARGSRNGAGK